MNSPYSELAGTRIGEMLSSYAAHGLAEKATAQDRAELLAASVRLIYAAMGVEFIFLHAETGVRSPSEALKHWLEFCALSNKDLFGTAEKVNAFKPIFIAALKDAQDIRRGKI